MKKTFPNTLAATALLLVPAGLLAQTTGTSHPEDLHDDITTSAAPSQHYVKPSAAVPVGQVEGAASTQPMQSAQPVLVQRVAPAPRDYSAPQVQYAAPPQSGAFQSAPVQTARVSSPEAGMVITDDPDSGVVLEIPSAPHELPAGSLLHVTLSAEVSTIVTQRGEEFHARLLLPVARRGEVLLPAGSMLTGRVAEIHTGNKMHGGAVIQLVPEFVTLPDGIKHHLQAQVVDLPSVEDAKVNDEGVIRGKTNIKATAAAVGLTTASATVAGAVIGGGVGAAVGATVGVGVATVWWLKHEQEQTLPAGTEIVFSLDRPLLLEPGPR